MTSTDGQSGAGCAVSMCAQGSENPVFPINISLSYSYLLCPQYRRGGPIIAVQVENEYGSYNMDKKYMAFVKTVSALLLWSVILWCKHIPDACSLSGTVNCADG